MSKKINKTLKDAKERLEKTKEKRELEIQHALSQINNLKHAREVSKAEALLRFIRKVTKEK